MLEESDVLRYTPPRRLKTIGIAALGIATLIVMAGVLVRERASQEESAWTAAQAVTTVQVIRLADVGAGPVLVLPGDIQALSTAPIYARVSGYLKRWYTDIGAPVKAGQLLAEIDTPELDQQFAQAKAQLVTAVANQNLAVTTAERWIKMRALDAVSQQDADEKTGDLAAKTALAASARANVARLAALESFKRIVAPFTGIVTSRSTDVGALISVGGANDAPLFTVVDESHLRIYVHVPQSDSAKVQPGMAADFTVPEYPGRKFPAMVTAMADAVDPSTGAQLVQLQVDGKNRALKPGDYVEVNFSLPANPNAITVPASALMFRDSGMVVATIGPNNRIVIKPVNIARDFGTVVEVDSGLTLADKLVNNPPDSLRQGDTVRVEPAAANHA